MAEQTVIRVLVSVAVIRVLVSVAVIRVLVLLAAGGCAGGAWQPVVVGHAPRDPDARLVTLPVTKGQTGTELVLAVLARAKSLEVGAISGFEIQVGPCVREVASRPRPVPATPSLETERIVLAMREPAVECRRRTRQELVPKPREPGAKQTFSEVKLITTDECDQVAVAHVVLRYRYEVEHGFVPPDWQVIERSTGAQLAFGAPQCGRDPTHEIRAWFHRAADRSMPAPRATPSRRADILALVERARSEAEAGHGAEATRLAELALAALPDDTIVDTALADAIAAAHFFAVEADVEKFLAREPAEVDARWLEEITSEIDRIAKRYERMQDLVRTPAIARWLEAGGARVARMNAHVDDLLLGAGYRRKQ